MSKKALDEIKTYEALIRDMADEMMTMAEMDVSKALSMTYDLEEHVIDDSGGFKTTFNRLLVHEAIMNVEKGLNMDMSLLKAGDIFIAVDYKEALSKIREDVYQEIEATEWVKE